MASYCDIAPGHPYHGPYHAKEYGFPIRDDSKLFERLALEINQAGLSWLTILKKRENFRAAFDGFDVDRVAAYGRKERARLLRDAGIIRNRLKIESAIQNAQAFLAVQQEFGSFDQYLWDFTEGRTIQNAWRSIEHVPAHTPESDTISKDLKRRGFKFVGSTICYAFMQAVGMVNDHLVKCHRHEACAKLAK